MTSTIILTKSVISSSNNYSLGGTITVNVETTNVSNRITSGIVNEFQYPSLASTTTVTPQNYIVDLRQSIESWVIDGYLVDDVGGDTAITKAQKLIAIKQAGGTLDSFTYRSLSISNGCYIYTSQGDDIDYDPDDIVRGGEAKIKLHMEIRRGKPIGT